MKEIEEKTRTAKRVRGVYLKALSLRALSLQKIAPVLALIALLMILPFISGLYPIVRFTGERIDIDVFPEHVIVRGYYHYSNPLPFPVRQGLTIPFPVDEDHPEPVLLSVRRAVPSEGELPVLRTFGTDRFEAAFSAYEDVTIVVEYRQHSATRDATYLLTTTAPWGRPLERGLYRLFPMGVDITGSNYALSPLEDGAMIFKKEDFMPDKEWGFSWEVREEVKEREVKNI